MIRVNTNFSIEHLGNFIFQSWFDNLLWINIRFNRLFWFVKIFMNWFQVSRSYLLVVVLFDIKCVLTSFGKETLDLKNNLILEDTECNDEVYLAPNHIFGILVS
jgi:hypothetical protein